MPDPVRLSAEQVSRRNARDESERIEADSAAAFATVRALLVSEEQDDLATLRARIERMEQDESDPEIRARRTAAILAQAFEHAALEDGDRIGEILGPAIGEGIRHQLANDRPAMVASLVPMVGSLVAGAVAEAMDKVSNGINDRVDRLFSFRGLKLAIGAKAFGASLNDALIADLRRSEIERLYLFNRATDRLAFTWPQREEGDGLSDRTADEILQGVLGMSGQILNEGDHAVRSIAIGDRHLVIRAGAVHTVVIEVTGALSDDRRAALGNACFEVLDFVSNLTDDRADANLDDEVMALFANRVMVETPVASAAQRKRGPNPALCLAALLAIAIIGTVGWRLYDGHRIQSRAATIEDALRANFAPGALMLSVDPDRGAGTIAVAGAAFAAVDRSALESRARDLAQPYALIFDLATGDPDAAAPRLGAMEQRLEYLDTSATRIDNTLATVDTRAEQGVTALAALRDPARQLSDFVASHAVFFAIESALRDPDRASADLDRLAALMVAAPDRPLRVIGYSDNTGSRTTNLQVANARANAIAAELQARGIPSDRLIAFGRIGPEWSISPNDGTGSPNRRVEFSLGFMGEQP